MKVIVARFYPTGVDSSVRDTEHHASFIAAKRSEGFLIKEQIGTYRPGYYTTEKEFLSAPGKLV